MMNNFLIAKSRLFTAHGPLLPLAVLSAQFATYEQPNLSNRLKPRQERRRLLMNEKYFNLKSIFSVQFKLEHCFEFRIF